MRITATHIFTLMYSFALIGCSDTSFKSDDKKGDGKSIHDEDDQADEPVQVSGAYLTCDWIEDKKEDPGESTLIGCGVYDKTGTIFPKKGRDYQLSLHSQDGAKVSMKTSDAGENESFHRYAKLPSEFNNSGYLKMTVRKASSKQGEYLLSTVDIGSSIGLGNEGQGYDYNDDISISEVTSHAQWSAGPFGFIDKIRTSDFCKSGKITSELGNTSQAMIAAASILSMGSVNTPTTKVSSASKTFSKDENEGCFVKFKSDTDGSKQYAHKSEDGSCLFLRFAPSKSTSSDVLHIVKVGSTDLALESLRAFAASKASCK